MQVNDFIKSLEPKIVLRRLSETHTLYSEAHKRLWIRLLTASFSVATEESQETVHSESLSWMCEKNDFSDQFINISRTKETERARYK